MVHTLQMELEGTRDTVIGLERRLDDLHEDLSSISRNVSNLLRMVSQSPCPSMYMSNMSLLPGHLQNNMAASGQLHPGYSYNNMAASCSPSPNPSSMYQTPTFYFSESTDGENSGCGGGGLTDGNGAMTDARDNVSLFSGSNCSPMPPPDIGNFQIEQGAQANRNRAGENFLSPFQSGHLLKSSAGGSRGSMAGLGFSSPSPLHSPRVNFTPSPMSSHFPSFPRTPASPSLSKTLADRGGPPPASSGSDMPSRGTLGRLHSPSILQPVRRRARTPDAQPSTASPSTFYNSNSTSTTPAAPVGSPQLSGRAHSKDLPAASLPEKVKPSTSFPSPKAGRSQSPRPSNLSPLQPRFPKLPHKRFTRASYPGGSSTSAGITMSPLALELNFPSPVSTPASYTGGYTSPPEGRDSPNRSPLLRNNVRAQEFQGEYYTLTQLEPCDGGGKGVCEKGSAMRRSEQDLARSSLSLSEHTLEAENLPLGRSVDSSMDTSNKSSSPKSGKCSTIKRQSPSQHQQQQQQQQHRPQHQFSCLSKTPSPSSSLSTITTSNIQKSSPSYDSKPSGEQNPANRLPVRQTSLGSNLATTTTPATKAKRPQSLSPSSIRLHNSPPGLDFIDSHHTRAATDGARSSSHPGLCSSEKPSTQGQGRESPAGPRQLSNSPRTRATSDGVRDGSTSAQAGGNLTRSRNSGFEAGVEGTAPLSQAESASDLDDRSPSL